MNVCHIITKLELGGAQLSTFHILSRLPKDQHKVSLITSSHGILKGDFRSLKGVKCHFLPFLHRPINPLFDLIAFFQIYFICRCERYSVVHTHSSKAGILGRWAAWLAGVPVIVHTVHGWSFNDFQKPLFRKLFIFLEKATARFTTKIICVSRKDIETSLKHEIAQEEKFEFIKYGIPLSRFRKSSGDMTAKRRALGISNDGPVVGMISCLKPQKSPLDYIKAAVRINQERPDLNFLLVGDGTLRRACQDFLAKSSLNGRFIFVGWRRDVSDILDVMDVAVLTSKWEGMPISLIEALSKGCPVVATGVGGTPELVKNRVTGYITRPGAYEEIAEKVLEIFEGTQTLSKMKREAARSIDDSFDVTKMVANVQNLYRRLT